MRGVGPPPKFTGKNMLRVCLERVRTSIGLPYNPSQADVQTLGSIIMGMGFSPDPKWRHLPKSLQVAGFLLVLIYHTRQRQTCTQTLFCFLKARASVSMVEKGYISRMNAVFLVASWPLLMLITRSMMKGPPSINRTSQRWSHHLFLSVLGFIGVGAGAYITVQSVIALSAAFSIPEYLVSFFIVAFGTSLPEIVVDLTAIRKKQYEIAIGDAIGSSIIDAGFSIGIGTLFFPGNVTASLAEKTGLYALMCSIVVVTILALCIGVPYAILLALDTARFAYNILMKSMKTSQNRNGAARILAKTSMDFKSPLTLKPPFFSTLAREFCCAVAKKRDLFF
jgi:Ca2+/H+ antiporter